MKTQIIKNKIFSIDEWNFSVNKDKIFEIKKKSDLVVQSVPTYYRSDAQYLYNNSNGKYYFKVKNEIYTINENLNLIIGEYYEVYYTPQIDGSIRVVSSNVFVTPTPTSTPKRTST